MADSKGPFEAAIAAFDSMHREDPERDAQGNPHEILYAQRMSEWLQKLCRAASEPLRLAARCQHIRRWAIRRGDYPEGVAGYREWRVDEASAHAAVAKGVLEQAGYDRQTVERVQQLVRKLGLKRDPEAQLLEDVICLVFLQYYFDGFAQKHDETKLVGILRKTWGKMSPNGHAAALALPLAPRLRALVEKALEGKP